MTAFLARLARSLARTAAAAGERFPHVTEGGRWRTLAGDDRPRWDGGRWRHGNWTGGFWIGCLWLALAVTGRRDYGLQARDWLARLDGRQRDDTSHDLGFLFYPSCAVGHAVSRDPALVEPALAAADRVAARFVPAAGYLQAWGPRGDPAWIGTSTIDTMMNLPLLWWATRATGDARYARVAAAHARTTRRHFVRSDGSTYHLIRYDPATGVPREKTTFQGYGPESCWARGQSWAIAGFAIAFRETGDAAFLAAADRTAEYFLRRLPADSIPYWDFHDPAIPAAPRDSSAAAIAADGLLELAAIHPDAARRRRYHAAAAGLLDALASRCENRDPDAVDGLVLHGCYAKPQGEGVDAALIWGDYFYLHARLWLARDRRPEDLLS
jgi:unsaturated chondroitin disaccharide hydrolase